MDSTPSKRRKLVNNGWSISSQETPLAMRSEELAATVRVQGDSANAADGLLVKVKASLEKIEGHEPMPMVKAAKKLEKMDQVWIPFTDPRSLHTCSREVSFVSPHRINVVGSYFFKSMITTSHDHLVDMTVEIPAEMLRPNDYLDLRYFFVRAYFLAVMAAALKRDFDGSYKVAYDKLHGNDLTPVIILRPRAAGEHDEGQQEGEIRDGPAYGIRIIPCLPEGFFPSKKLRPTACLVRDQGQDQSAVQQEPTPFHNSTLKAEACFTAYLKVIRQAEKSCSSFKEACVLGRIWLQQRGFGGAIHQGGFGPFEWSVLLSLLLQSGHRKGEATLSTSLTALQLFKATIRFLSLSDLVKKPLVLGSRSEDSGILTDAVPVIYDTVRCLNVAFKMSVSSAGMLQHYAKLTHSLLTNNMVDQFSPTFITKADIAFHNFDMVVEVKHNQRVLDKLSKADRRGQFWDVGDVMIKVLRRGLADKARLVHMWMPATSSWALSEDATAVDPSKSMHVGILYDPAHMGRKTDRGPSVEDKNEAEKFQNLWGEKSELRRFKDGTTVETLLWESDSADGVCEEMVRYLLMRHLQLGHVQDEVAFHKKGLDALVPLQASDAGVFGAARKQFSMLEQDLRDLEDLPLTLRQLRPICPELRLASVKTPTPASKSGPRPMAVVAYLEASGKWPDNLSAIQRVKTALLLKLGSLLEDAKPGAVTTHLGLEDAALDIENLAFLDIVYESGFSFRLRLHSDMEEVILERRTKDKTLDQSLRTESATLLATCRRLYTQLPLHSSTMQTYATRYLALSGTIRLLKTWFSSHALTSHFTDEFMELVALHVFVSPYPWDVPGSASTGFLRALHFLARWDWRSEPLLVDTTGEMTPTEAADVEKRLEAWRKLDPNMNHTVMYVATAHDLSGTAWTTLRGEPKPSKVVATRMTALARGASRLVRERGMQLDATALFQPSWKDYDVLIHLRRKAIKAMLKTYAGDGDEVDPGRAGERSRFKNLDERFGRAPLPLVDHPVRIFLGQLAAAYAGPLLMFHGAEDDAVVGCIWNPLLQRRTFRANLPCSYRPTAGCRTDEHDESTEDGQVVEVNREAILQEIARIGGDLVESIEFK